MQFIRLLLKLKVQNCKYNLNKYVTLHFHTLPTGKINRFLSIKSCFLKIRPCCSTEYVYEALTRGGTYFRLYFPMLIFKIKPIEGALIPAV